MFYHDDDKTNDYIADQVERMMFHPERVSDACDYTEFFQDLATVFTAPSVEERLDVLASLRDTVALRMAKQVQLLDGEEPPVGWIEFHAGSK